MTCPPGSDRSIGPRVNPACRAFDFTLAFEDVVLACVPAAVFLLTVPVSLARIVRRRHAASWWSWLLACKTVALTALAADHIALAVLRQQREGLQTSASLPADILNVLATAAALLLSSANHAWSTRPSNLLAIYLSVLVLGGIPRARTLWTIEPNGAAAATAVASVILVFSAVVFESIPQVRRTREGEEPVTPEQTSGFWIRATFAWLLPTFRLGYSKVIAVEDLPVMDAGLKSQVTHAQLAHKFSRYARHDRHGLVRACLLANLSTLGAAVIPRLCLTAFTFFQPLLLDRTVTWIGDTSASVNVGKGLIGAWALVMLGLAISQSIYQYQSSRFVSKVRGSLLALTYQKTLQTRVVEQGKVTAVSLVGTDIERIVAGFRVLHEVWASLLDVAIATWLLERKMYLACIAPVILVFGFIGLTGRLSVAANNAQQRWIGKVQERLRLTTSFLDGVKSLKLLGLTEKMSTIIQSARVEEIKASEGYRRVLIGMLLLSNTPLILAPMVTFAVYVIISVYWKNTTLEVAQAFTSLALIALLALPVVIFTQALPSVVECIGCFDRIQEFCHYATTASDAFDDPNDCEKCSVEPKTDQQTQAAVSFRNESFKWKETEPAVLHNVSIDIQPGKITALLGPVGSGKSTLLESILGETLSSASRQGLDGQRVSYCAQEPWLEDSTIRANILGASEFDAEWYRVVKDACGLTNEIQHLANKDDTRVGSKGANLSGGQRLRVALGRAVYARNRLVLLDDIFSGLDERAVGSISQRLLGPNGLFRAQRVTVVLATQRLQVLNHADTVLCVDNGVVSIREPQNNGYANLLHSIRPKKDAAVEEAGTETLDTSDDVPKEAANEVITDDARQRMHGDASIYKYYLAASGYLAVGGYALSMVLWMFFAEFSTVWVKWWSEEDSVHPNRRVGVYMGIYALFGVLGALCACATASCQFLFMISRSGFRLHLDLLTATEKSSYWFFTSVTSGEIMNRFSQDMELIDMALPIAFGNYASTAVSCLAQLLVLLVFSRYLAIALPLLAATLYAVQRFYLRTSRQIRLLGIEAKAALYTAFMDSEAGAVTIRAFGWQSHYQHHAYRLIDTSQRPVHLQNCIQDWLTFVLDVVMAAVTVLLIAIVVTWRAKFNAGSVGISLVMIIGFGSSLTRLITNWTAMESSIGAISCVKAFVDRTDADDSGASKKEALDPAWPQAGAVQLSHVSASYREGERNVLSDVSLSVTPHQHIAICGSSGSGKTSLMLATLQMIHAQGEIVIDGVNVSQSDSRTLCQRISVIPQDACIMPGTVRFNVDPWGAKSDEDVQRALERVGLADAVSSRGGISVQMDVKAWSAGQRQLLGLARAMMKDARILILDEASSSVDTETENTIQDIIDSYFKHVTVLAIMHRLNHIERYDKVALFDSGRLMAYDEPANLIVGSSFLAELKK
ncbi:P-loop containing nucleoside triphosphate hydrolase protein [Neohortaea acidophila]|uniref:P-loop containing nucleoside triphosphate hydrolase protein n=1 Tax=Neohortaea acidophila TaxID=245834 RepID=A0A6A6PK15_9PEZI|nr:P-loop containing nucleoside triphosphate hydrolase protein [Neohortaea acidophila]KAF2480400.1 P-loop containing nucleoside triphosphate hydrolase protein [Neohortaea acidophila]